jgi:hypothetical protein
MRQLKLLFFTALNWLLFFGVNQAQFTQVRQLPDFSMIRVYGGVELEIVPDEINKAILRTELPLDRISTEVRDSILIIRDKALFNRAVGSTYIKLHIKEVHNILVQNGSRVKCSEKLPIKGNRFIAEVSGKSKLDINLISDTIKVEAVQSAEVVLKGRVGYAYLFAATNALIDARNLRIEKMKSIAKSKGEIDLETATQAKVKSLLGGQICFETSPDSLYTRRFTWGVINFAQE